VLALAVAVSAAASPGPPPTRRELRLLVVLAGFPDRPLAKQRSHFTGRRTSLVDRLVAYYDDVSSHRLWIVPTVGRTLVTLPGNRASYVQRPDAIARDALVAFAATTDADDLAALGAADALLVFFAGAGRESHPGTGDASDPWSNYTALVPAVVIPGARPFIDACVIAEKEVRPFSSFGVLCHEFGHLLGLPELYAPGGLPQEGIGVWGLMGQGTWLGRGERPPHLCAWSKHTLGWLDVETVTETRRNLELPAVELAPRAIKIPAAPDHPKEYYLIENRGRIGADRRLPGEGLLVWHVDEAVEGFRTGETKVARKLLHLVEADGRGDLDRGHAAGGNRGDPGDPWSGPPSWRRRAGAALGFLGAVLVAAAVLRAMRPRPVLAVLGLGAVAAVALASAIALRRGPVCGPATPGMAPYAGGAAPVTIRNISPPGRVMHFDVLVPPAPDRR
jgi:immune inhibitor A